MNWNRKIKELWIIGNSCFLWKEEAFKALPTVGVLDTKHTQEGLSASGRTFAEKSTQKEISGGFLLLHCPEAMSVCGPVINHSPKKSILRGYAQLDDHLRYHFIKRGWGAMCDAVMVGTCHYPCLGNLCIFLSVLLWTLNFSEKKKKMFKKKSKICRAKGPVSCL